MSMWKWTLSSSSSSSTSPERSSWTTVVTAAAEVEAEAEAEDSTFSASAAAEAAAGGRSLAPSSSSTTKPARAGEARSSAGAAGSAASASAQAAPPACPESSASLRVGLARLSKARSAESGSRDLPDQEWAAGLWSRSLLPWSPTMRPGRSRWRYSVPCCARPDPRRRPRASACRGCPVPFRATVPPGRDRHGFLTWSRTSKKRLAGHPAWRGR
jgi:hypothetical protein